MRCIAINRYEPSLWVCENVLKVNDGDGGTALEIY
jgi:hypothetical protein